MPNLELDRLKKVQIDWHDLTVSAQVPAPSRGLCSRETVTKTILSKCTGSAKHGQMMAVMGSSGAGKSTFMNALTYRNVEGLHIEGSVKACGIALKSKISKISAYIQQDDHFVGALTVREHLQFHADLRLSKESRERRKEVIKKIVNIIGLEDCVDTLIGTLGMTKTISGGEMKRLSIAAEILTDPPVIFADEPTSGLDSHLALSVVKTLKSLASTGTTVICTIHQPSSEIFEEFDSLLLLTMGRTAFCGPIKEGTKFFNEIGNPVPHHYNPADHFIREISQFRDINSGGSTKDENVKQIRGICNAYEESNHATTIKSNQIKDPEGESINDQISMSKSFRPNPFYAFWKILLRGMIANYRDRSLTVIKIAQNVAIGVVVGLVYLRVARPGISSSNPSIHPYNSNDVFNSNGAMFAYVCSFSFNYLFLVVFTFPRMAIILRREYYSGLYQLWVAIMADMLALVPFTLIMPFLFVSITYFMVGLKSSAGAFFFQYFTLFQIAFCATGYGYLISSLSRSVEIANALAAPMMLPMMLFGGFFVQADTVPDYFIWIKYISWFYYGTENLYVNQWRDMMYCDDKSPPCSDSNNPYVNNTHCEKFFPGSSWKDGSAQLQTFGYNEDNLERNIGIMFGIAIGFRLLGYMVMAFKYRTPAR